MFLPRDLHPGGGHPLRDWPEPGTDDSLRWILENEMVVHLDDLLLRRTHLGFLRPHGAEASLEALRPLCLELLGWDEERWGSEVARYHEIIEQYYGVPELPA
jgi:glycerol-3-phosphate dehydrogenase